MPGRGIMLIARKGLIAENRLLIAKVKYEADKEIIVGGFHLNQLKKK